MSSDFDWNTDGSVVVPKQRAMAVFRNARGTVTIVQEGLYGVSDDVEMEIAPAFAVTHCKAVLRASGLHHMMIAPVCEVELTKPDGKRLRIPAETLAEIDAITEEMVAEETAARQARRPKDPKAKERKRRQRERDAKRHAVTGEDVTANVTLAPPLSTEHERPDQGGRELVD